MGLNKNDTELAFFKICSETEGCLVYLQLSHYAEGTGETDSGILPGLIFNL
jgi:hypothetical protein